MGMPPLDLADPHRPRLHQPPAARAAQEFLRPLRERCLGTSQRDIGDSWNPRGSGRFGMGSQTAAVGTGPAADCIDLRQTARGARSVPRCGVDVATAR